MIVIHVLLCLSFKFEIIVIPKEPTTPHTLSTTLCMDFPSFVHFKKNSIFFNTGLLPRPLLCTPLSENLLLPRLLLFVLSGTSSRWFWAHFPGDLQPTLEPLIPGLNMNTYSSRQVRSYPHHTHTIRVFTQNMTQCHKLTSLFTTVFWISAPEKKWKVMTVVNFIHWMDDLKTIPTYSNSCAFRN